MGKDEDPGKDVDPEKLERAMGKYTVQQLMVNMKSKRQALKLLVRY